MSPRRSFGRSPPANPAEMTTAGMMAVQERLGGRRSAGAAGARLDQHDATAAEFALANDESLAAERDDAVEQVFRAAGLDAQGEDDAEMAGFAPRTQCGGF